MKKNLSKASVLLIICMVLISSNVFASNHGNTSLQFTGGGGGTVDSPQREKQNATSVYFRPTYFTGVNDGDWFIVKAIPGSGSVDFDSGNTGYLRSMKDVPSNGFRISQNAYEDNNGSCYIKINAKSRYALTYSYYMGAVWSPDSI